MSDQKRVIDLRTEWLRLGDEIERRCEIEDREASQAERDALMDAYWAMCEDDDERIAESAVVKT